jgi:hypothetical protein
MRARRVRDGSSWHYGARFGTHDLLFTISVVQSGEVVELRDPTYCLIESTWDVAFRVRGFRLVPGHAPGCRDGLPPLHVRAWGVQTHRPVLLAAVRRTGATRILDLCSCGGGPQVAIYDALIQSGCVGAPDRAADHVRSGPSLLTGGRAPHPRGRRAEPTTDRLVRYDGQAAQAASTLTSVAVRRVDKESPMHRFRDQAGGIFESVESWIATFSQPGSL